jgi:hypothetical protein
MKKRINLGENQIMNSLEESLTIFFTSNFFILVGKSKSFDVITIEINNGKYS